MKVVFVKAAGAGAQDRTFLTRAGVAVQVAVHVGHDLPHLVVESAFGIEDGLWGELAAGRHEASNRATTARDPKRRKVGRLAAGEPQQPTDEWLSDGHRYAKVVTNCVTNRWGDGPDTPAGTRARLAASGIDLAAIDDDTIDRAIRGVRDLMQRWADTPPGEALRLSWPLPRDLL